MKAIQCGEAASSQWEGHCLSTAENEELIRALHQSYRYLGGGGQCFAMSSADDQYVIKFIKQKHFILSPWLKFLPWIQQRKKEKKEQLRNTVLSAFKAGFDELQEQTGLLYVHLNPTKHLQIMLEVYDEKGIEHVLNLDDVQFVIQKKATLAYSYIDLLVQKNDIEGAKRAIHQLLNLHMDLYKHGFRNRDSNFRTNCGFINDQAILIDMGRIVPCIPTAKIVKRDLKKTARQFRKYLEEKHPQLLFYFDSTLDHWIELISRQSAFREKEFCNGRLEMPTLQNSFRLEDAMTGKQPLQWLKSSLRNV